MNCNNNWYKFMTRNTCVIEQFLRKHFLSCESCAIVNTCVVCPEIQTFLCANN